MDFDITMRILSMIGEISNILYYMLGLIAINFGITLWLVYIQLKKRGVKHEKYDL